MTNIRNENQSNKFTSIKTADGFVLRGAAAGDLDNDKIKTCKLCAHNGFPHEPIKIEKINGKVLANGTNEIAGYRLLDYYSDKEHTHKDLFLDLAPILWSKSMAKLRVKGVSSK
jgi:hypothetical protein